MALLKKAFVGLFMVFHTCTWGAWAVMEVNMEDRVEVFRKDTAQITCMFKSADGLGGVMIQWVYVAPPSTERHRIYYQDSTMHIVEKGTLFSDRISVNDTGATGEQRELVLTIRDVTLNDALDFICVVQGLTDGTDEGLTQLKVFETPAFPSIERVHTGISVTNEFPSKIGSCEAKNGFPRPNITWYRDNTPLQNIANEVNMLSLVTMEASGMYSVKSDLSMMVTKEDKDSEFYCEVTYLVPGGTRMTETPRINITVYFPTTSISVWVESPKGDVKEGDTVELQCRGDGNPQPPLSFYHGDEEKTADSNGVLVLKGASRADSGTYKCESWDFDTDVQTMGNTTLMVNYLDPAVVEPETRTLSLGEGMTATCNALSSLHTKAAWFKDGQQVHKGHTLTLKNAMFDTAGTYVCVITVPSIESMETSDTLRLFVQGPPEIREPQNTPIEEHLEKTVNLSCHARGYPVPSISWSSSDAQVLKSVSHKATEDAIHSVVSVKVTSDITAFCNASNDHGSEAVSFSIKAIKLTTKPASTTTTSTTSSTSTATEGSGVIIAVIIICILLLAILGSVLYFLYKKGKICGRSGKQDLTKEKNNKDNIVVEMKSDNTEEAVLLGVNGDKKLPSDQSNEYLDVQK